MNLFGKPKGNCTVERVIINEEIYAPNVFIDLDALIKMKSFVENCSTEIAWLGMVEVEDDNYYITDVDLIEQEVTGVTAEMHEDGLQKYAEKLMQSGDYETLNKIKCWGHSHVNMDVEPSGTDEQTFIEYYSDCKYFIRIIANKKGVLKVDLVESEKKLRFDNIDWSIRYPEEMTKDMKKLVEMENTAKKINDKFEKMFEKKLKDIQKDVKDQINKTTKSNKSKVKKTSSSNSKTNNYFFSHFVKVFEDGIKKFKGVNEVFSMIEIEYIATVLAHPTELKERYASESDFAGYAEADWIDLYDNVCDYYVDEIESYDYNYGYGVYF